MNVGQMEAFLQVVRHGSFSKASEALSLTQPSLSARIISLEMTMSETLFHRMGRGVRLTDAGRILLPYIERSLNAISSGEKTLRASRTASAGPLHIGAATVVCSYVLPDILAVFHQRYPGIDVSIKTGRSSQVLEMVLKEDVQVGISRTLVHPEIEAQHLYDEHVVLVTHPTHPFAKAGEASIYDVASEPLILYDKESTYFVLITRVCREAGIVPNIQMDLDSVEATKQMIERGLGISFLPHNSIRRELQLGILAEVSIIEGHQVKLPTSIMIRRTQSKGAIVKAFLKILEELYPKWTSTAPR
jgi:DNA-binding transcriptional LysR family regulator